MDSEWNYSYGIVCLFECISCIASGFFFICVCVSLCLKIAEPIRGKYCKERERAKQRSTVKAGEKMEVSQDRSKGQPDLWKG